VRGAYLHDLKAADRDPIPVDQGAVDEAEATVITAAEKLRAREYEPNPGPHCRRCEVRTICPHARL